MIVFYAGFVCQRVPAGRSDELTKEGVAAGGFRLKFGVKLDSDEPGMVLEFDDFDEASFRVDSRRLETLLFEVFHVAVIELVAVTMPLLYEGALVCCVGPGTFGNPARIGSQSHGPSEIFDPLLFCQEADDRMFG